MFPAYKFYDLQTNEGKVNNSTRNEDEACAVLEIFAQLCALHPDIKFAGLVGIITPYRG